MSRALAKTSLFPAMGGQPYTRYQSARRWHLTYQTQLPPYPIQMGKLPLICMGYQLQGFQLQGFVDVFASQRQAVLLTLLSWDPLGYQLCIPQVQMYLGISKPKMPLQSITLERWRSPNVSLYQSTSPTNMKKPMTERAVQYLPYPSESEKEELAERAGLHGWTSPLLVRQQTYSQVEQGLSLEVWIWWIHTRPECVQIPHILMDAEML